MTIGQRIRAARLDVGLSQKQLAHLAGMSQSNLSELENDHASTTTFTPQLAEVLKVPAIWLAEGRLTPAPDSYRQTAVFVRHLVEVIARECGVTLDDLVDDSPEGLDRLQAKIAERHKHLK